MYEWTYIILLIVSRYVSQKNHPPQTFLNVMRLLKRCVFVGDRISNEAWICKAKKQRSIRQTRGRNHVSVSCTDIKSHAKSLRQVWRANLHRRHMYTHIRGKTWCDVRRIDRFGSGTFQPPPRNPLSILQPEFQADDMFFD